MNAYESCPTSSDDDQTCISLCSQLEDVSVTVRLNTYAKLGELKLECCGEPSVVVCSCQNTCNPSGCEIIITQTIKARIPIEYSVCAESGATCVTCQDGLCNACK